MNFNAKDPFHEIVFLITFISQRIIILTFEITIIIHVKLVRSFDKELY